MDAIVAQILVRIARLEEQARADKIAAQQLELRIRQLEQRLQEMPRVIR